MVYEIPRLEGDFSRVVTDIVIGFGNGDASINIIKDIIANARAEERERCAKVAESDETRKGRCGFNTHPENVSRLIAHAIRNLGDE